MKPITLNKTLDPADYGLLTEELALVDQHFTTEREQHPHRRWEYAMALRAFHVHSCTGCDLKPRSCYDIGGGGSPFVHMLRHEGHPVAVIDPDAGETTLPLDRFVHTNPALADAVFCLSVLEHVEDDLQFLYHLACLVQPGGLLVVTTDACGCAADHGAPDPHHFHWMRKQIYNTRTAQLWIDATLLGQQFDILGGYASRDLHYHGDHVYDYSFRCHAFVKRS